MKKEREKFTWKDYLLCISVFSVLICIVAFNNYLDDKYDIYTDINTEDDSALFTDDCYEEIGDTYITGLTRGCDLGCLQATKQIHNISEPGYLEEYMSTEMYPKCAEYCIENFRREE